MMFSVFVAGGGDRWDPRDARPSAKCHAMMIMIVMTIAIITIIIVIIIVIIILIPITIIVIIIVIITTMIMSRSRLSKPIYRSATKKRRALSGFPTPLEEILR